MGTRNASTFTKGDPRTKLGGRKLGSKDKKTVAKEAIEALIAQREQRNAGSIDPDYTPALPGDRRWIMPLEFMLVELNDARNSRSFRANMAIQAAPYCHRKMPSGVDKQTEGSMVVTPFDLENLEPHEIQILIELSGKISDVQNRIVDMED